MGKIKFKIKFCQLTNYFFPPLEIDDKFVLYLLIKVL